MMSPEATSIFNQTKPFLDGVQALNAAKEDDVTTCFTMLCTNGGNGRGDNRETIGVDDVRLKDTLSTILDRVAYFPVRPADMKAELEKVGVKGKLASSMSQVWADQARSVVATRKRVVSDLQGVDYKLLTNVVTGEERIRLSLTLNQQVASDDANPNYSAPVVEQLSFAPDQLFGLFEQLETVQKRIDKICS